MIERLTSVHELPVAQVQVVARLREVTQAGVDNMADLIRRNGFLGRILVRRTPKGDFLLDGAHRLAAVQLLGMPAIPCDVVRCNETEALALECDGNLGGRGLSPLELAYFMAQKREAYQKLYPDMRQGHAGQAIEKQATEFGSLAQSIAMERNITPRQVYKIMAAGAAIGPDEYRKLSQSRRAVTLKDLEQIAKITNAAERYHVVDSLAEGKVKNAAAARKVWKAEHSGLPQPVKDRVEEAFQDLMNLWERASETAQRRFVAEHRDSLLALMEDLDD